MKNRLRVRTILFALAIEGALTSCASAQLRIVDYNTAGIQSNGDMQTVLAAISNENVNGIIKPIDVMILQELSSGDINTMVSNLNALGVGTYVAGNVGSTTGGGGVGLIYRDQSIDLIAQSQVVNTAMDGAARGVMRYTLRPAGYDSAADFYIYASHYKASDTGSDRARRNVEATAIRANADALGQGAHIIYAGDFNTYNFSTESMMATLTAAGNGQAFDPLNQLGQWHINSSYKAVHTQNPAGEGFVGGGMDDRFDWQMISGELRVEDGEGMAIIAGSYHAFGNNNTHAMDGHINSGSGASPTVLNALGAASDHLPVVAQYQVPAKMAVTVSTPPAQVLVGASLMATVNVSNSAGDNQTVNKVVVDAIGADELDYTVAGSMAASGSVNGTDAALGGSNDHNIALNTATAGTKTARFTTNATAPQVPSPTSVIDRNYSVLDHATPSFLSPTLTPLLVHDFGTVEMGVSTFSFNFSVFNLNGMPGFTADMDFDSVMATGDSTILTTNLSDYDEGTLVLAGGANQMFSAMLNSSSIGDFAATYTLIFSDENLPGALEQSLTLTLTGEVLAAGLPGDYNDDSVVNAADYAVWRDHLGSSYDLKGNGDEMGASMNTVDGADFLLWRSSFGNFDIGTSSLTDTSTVPEPSGFDALVITIAVLSGFIKLLPRM